MSFIGDMDIYFFRKGTARRAYRFMGCHPSKTGFSFNVWAPNAQSISVKGDFNDWNPDTNTMELDSETGIWSADIPGVHEWMKYKYHIVGADGKAVDKLDPYAFFNEHPPSNASVVKRLPEYDWNDSEWMAHRNSMDIYHSPVSIYEAHSSSFKRKPDGSILTWSELADEMIPWVKSLGYTHIELMPVTEYPLDDSWGYQVTGYFAPTSRHGDPGGLMYFIDRCHSEGIGVLLDWVPAHFPKDEHALSYYDGTALYEHSDSRLGEQPQWGTAVFNYSRSEVCNFLISSAVYWLSEYHFDGLRVDAVSSMLYRSFGREDTGWLPNESGGDENTEGVAFIRQLSRSIKEETPGALLIAEEATSWEGVTRPPSVNGLGFSFKWNMGWMNDILNYIKTPFGQRSAHYSKLTFALHYAFKENYVLPFSHDEVIHGKKTLLDKMPGTYEQRFSGLRALMAYMYAMPGQKLLFMGNEMAPFMEWRYYEELEWPLLEYPVHDSFKNYICDLNAIYKKTPPLWDEDHSWDGYRWVVSDDTGAGIISFERLDRSGGRLLAVINFMPLSHNNYRLGFPDNISIKEIFNSENAVYSGCNITNKGIIKTKGIRHGANPYSLEIKIPPLSAIYFSIAECK